MAVAERIYAQALYAAAQEQGRVGDVRSQLAELSEGADPLVRNFLSLVAEKGRAAELAAMAGEFDAIVDRAEGRITVELTTAHELTDSEATAIVQTIEQASGRSVEATRSVDSRQIGGIVLQAGSLRVDASVRGRIERLRRTLVTRN